MTVLIVLYILAMATATFIENDYGTTSSKSLVYNARWFELLMLWLTVNFIGNIFRYKLYTRKKWPVLLLHLSFVVILFGSLVTRYMGFEGVMSIREGAASNEIITETTYITATVKNNAKVLVYEEDVMLSPAGNNKFKMNCKHENTPFTIEYKSFIPNARPVFNPVAKGKTHLHIVFLLDNGRREIYLAENEIMQVGKVFVGFNKPQEGVINFVQNDTAILLQPTEDGTYMEMMSQEQISIPKDSLKPAQFLKLYAFSSTQFVVKEVVKGEMSYVSAGATEKGMFQADGVEVTVKSGNETKDILLIGGKSTLPEPVNLKINGLNINLKYGSKIIETPFDVRLRDFQLERYPGTMSPSSYASEVTVLDGNTSFDYRIFMNHVLDYEGYRFFQSSYDFDEKGTILSVNHDYWGTLISYIGYFIMSLSMFLILFWKGSRFYSLTKKLFGERTKATILILSISMFTSFANAQESPSSSKAPAKKLVVSRQHAEKFGRLLTQDFHGRVKPVNTYALEALRKIYKKDSYQGLTAEQVMLSSIIDPYTWAEEYIIHVKQNALGLKMSSDLQVRDGLTSAANFYKTGQYYLQGAVTNISIKKNLDRTSTDKEVINLDERFNVYLEVLNGSLLQIYPIVGDENNKWTAIYDGNPDMKLDSMVLKLHYGYLYSLVKAVETNDYKEADFYLDKIKEYQQLTGKAIIPPVRKTELEIKYNHWNIFKYLMMFYMVLGFVMLTLAVIKIFASENKIINIMLNLFTFVTFIGLLAHLAGLGLRWYISEHAPWSNGYEAVLFVASVIVFAGLLFSLLFRKTKIIIALGVIMASLFLGIAHGSTMNPEITNLVPVLKSYWLMIHVAVITGSYAFLGLGSIIAMMVMAMYIFRTKANAGKLQQHISDLTVINEMTLTVGLFALSIGTFLGGVWASESWGRYWSWDPKEVWSLISMMVYVFVLHMRIVPGLKGNFAFNLASLWSISTLIMTFFGVNFYLSGMHSYSAGDPVPIPFWVYIAVVFFTIFSIISYIRYKSFNSKA